VAAPPQSFDWKGWLIVAFTGATAGSVILFYALDRRRASRDAKRRYALKDLIGKQMDELTSDLLYHNTGEEFDERVTQTARLIDASLGRMEEQWVLEPIPGGAGVSDTEEKRIKLLKQVHLRLHELASRMDSIPIRPDFDPKKWRRR
jgi:hypothetical protein